MNHLTSNVVERAAKGSNLLSASFDYFYDVDIRMRLEF